MRLIDADALARQIQQEPTDGMYTEEILAVVAAQPTVEAAPVVHARWLEKVDMIASILAECEETFVECSMCGAANYGETPYCPNCGARMVGDADG